MATDTELQLKIRALVEGANQVKGLADQVALLGKTGRVPIADPTAQLRAGADRTRHSMGLLSQSVFTLKNTVGTLAVTFAVREIVRAADTYKQLSGRLTLVTSSAQELVAVEQALFETAQRTRSSYESTVELYARVARNAKSLGASQAELLQLTETVNQAIQVGGSVSSEAAAGVIQFSQALASGTLRGDELRSVLENMPRLSQAIIDGLGAIGVGANLTLGDLRRMSEQGELTSQLVFKALLTQSDALKREFATLPRTVGQAMTQLVNDVQRALARADMAPLLDGIDDLRDRLKEPEFVAGLVGFANLLATATSWALRLASAIGGIPKLGSDLKIAMFDTPQSIAATGDVDKMNTFINAKRAARDRILERQRIAAESSNPLRRMFQGADAGDAETLAGLQREIDAVERVRLAYMKRNELRDSAAKVDLTKKPPAGTGGTAQGDDQAAKAAARALDRSQEILAGLRQQIDLYNQTSDAAGLRYEIENGLLKGLLPQHKMLALQYADQLAALEKQATADKESKKLTDEGIALKEKARTAQEELNASLAHYQVLQAAGAIDQQTYDRLAVAARAAFDAQDEGVQLTRELRTEQEVYNDTIAHYAELLGRGSISLETFRRGVEKSAEALKGGTDKMSEFAIQAARNMQSAFADFLFDPFSQGLQGMLSGFVDVLRRMASEALAAKLGEALFGNLLTSGAGAAAGGAGGSTGLIGGLLAGLFHDGGIAGQASMARRMPAFAYAMAPRYHGGGIAGLAADEVPAVLRRGEEVLAGSDPRHRNNGGLAPVAAPQFTVRNINLFDTQMIGDYLATSPGERAVLNVVSRNKAALGLAR